MRHPAKPSPLTRFADFLLAKQDGTESGFPPHIQMRLHWLQERSELIIAGIHLVMFTALTVMLFFGIEAWGEGSLRLQVILAVAGMACITSLQVWLASRMRTPRWFHLSSIVFEMLLMTFLIWAYHEKTEPLVDIESRTIYFVYVFILIALRTLRFEAEDVLISGVTGALCWLVIAMDDMPAHSGFALPFASLDKILSILFVSAILSLVLVRTRNMLLEAVYQSKATKNLSLFFDKDVAQKIAQGTMNVVPGQGELRPAAIIFTDLRGFTFASSKLTPNQLIDLLGEYQQLVVPIIQAHGGNIDKFMGDGILASFGAVNASTTYAADALRSVDDIVMALKLWQLDRASSGLITVDIGMGVGVGEVVFAVMGDETRLEFTVIGGTVNLAAKLEKHNKLTATRALTTRLGYEVAREQGYTGPEKQLLEHCEVAGVDHPIDLMKLA